MQVTRRSFLASAAAAAAAPVFLSATDKAGSKAPILGDGDHKYEAIHDWGELPRTIKYGNTHGVGEDSQGNIYVHHTVNASSDSLDTIVVFDHKGKFVRSWGRQFKGGAHGLTIRKEGSEEFLYLCDYQHGIVTKRTLKGEEVFTLATRRSRHPTSPKIKVQQWSTGPRMWPSLQTATYMLETDMAPASSTSTTRRPNLLEPSADWEKATIRSIVRTASGSTPAEPRRS